jgi:hypothetical protein
MKICMLYMCITGKNIDTGRTCSYWYFTMACLCSDWEGEAPATEHSTASYLDPGIDSVMSQM